jgi:hypothetical protein
VGVISILGTKRYEMVIPRDEKVSYGLEGSAALNAMGKEVESRLKQRGG